MKGYVLKQEAQQGIYIIFGKGGKCYIGQSIDLRRRLRAHEYELRKGKHKNRYLQATYDKYGHDFFVFEILEIVENRDDLNEREQYYIDEYDSFRNGYNLSMVVANEDTSAISKGSRPHTSAKVSEYWSCPERRREQSEKGKARFLENPEALVRMSVAASDPEKIERFKTRIRKWRSTQTPEQLSEKARRSVANRTPESAARADIRSKVTKAIRWLDDIIPKNNKMGYKNIFFCVHTYKETKYVFAVCRYKDWNTGKNYVRKFHAGKMGLIPAHAAASKWRDDVVTKMYLEFLKINDKEAYETTCIRYGFPYL